MSKEMVFNPITGIFDLVGIHEPKQIEVILSERVLSIVIDTSPLDIKEGDKFIISSNVVFQNHLGLPGNGRIAMNINNINENYFVSTNPPASHIRLETASNHVNLQTIEFHLINKDLIGFGSQVRVSSTTVYGAAILPVSLRGSNVQSVNNISFSRSQDWFAPGSKFAITKLT